MLDKLILGLFWVLHISFGLIAINALFDYQIDIFGGACIISALTGAVAWSPNNKVEYE